MISFIPLLWHKSPNCSCSSKVELVSTTTFGSKQNLRCWLFFPKAMLSQWLNKRLLDILWFFIYLELGQAVLSERSSVCCHRHIVVKFSQTRLTYFSSILPQILFTKVKLKQKKVSFKTCKMSGCVNWYTVEQVKFVFSIDTLRGLISCDKQWRILIK